MPQLPKKTLLKFQAKRTEREQQEQQEQQKRQERQERRRLLELKIQQKWQKQQQRRKLLELKIRQKQEQEDARLASWERWHDAYELHMQEIGFTIVNIGTFDRAEDKRWVRTPSPDSEDVRIELAVTERDSPSEFYLTEAIYQQALTWQEIQTAAKWFAKYEDNLLKLGFIKEGRHWKRRWDNLFSVDHKYPCNVIWTWPGARSDDYLPHHTNATTSADFTNLTLKDFDALLLNCYPLQYRYLSKSLLPSIRLETWEDRWLRISKKYPDDEIVIIEERMRIFYAKRQKTSLLDTSRDLTYSCKEKCSLSFTRSYRLFLKKFYPNCLDHVSFSPWPHEKSYTPFSSIGLLEGKDYWWTHVQAIVDAERAKTPRMSPVTSAPNVHFIETYKVTGFVDGVYTETFPDTGSDINVMTGIFARHRGYWVQTDPKYRITIRDAGGTKIRTKGIVKVPWAFKDKPDEQHYLTFHVLSKCHHPVILGGPFLQATNTMNKTDRIISCLVPETGVWDVCSIDTAGSSTPRMSGKVGGVDVLALADSGCRPNVMSLSFAERNNFHIKRGPEHQRILSFASCKQKQTAGQVTLPWIFDGDTTERDLTFEVLEGATHDVMLGQDILYGTKAFQTHKYCIASPSTHLPKVDPDWKKRRRSINYVEKPSCISRLFKRNKDPPPPSNKQRPDDLNEEMNRQAEAQYIIDKIPEGPEKVAAVEMEKQACMDWQSRRRDDSAGQNSSPSGTESDGSASQRPAIPPRVRLRHRTGPRPQ